MRKHTGTSGKKVPAANLFVLLFRYSGTISLLLLLTVAANALSVYVPRIISSAIDTYGSGTLVLTNVIVELSVFALLVFIFTLLQNIVQVYASERVARDMRNEITAKISVQPYSYIEKVGPAKLLTNLTSDVDAVKAFNQGRAADRDGGANRPEY